MWSIRCIGCVSCVKLRIFSVIIVQQRYSQLITPMRFFLLKRPTAHLLFQPLFDGTKKVEGFANKLSCTPLFRCHVNVTQSPDNNRQLRCLSNLLVFSVHNGCVNINTSYVVPLCSSKNRHKPVGLRECRA